MTETAVYAAGGVVWRLVEGELHILVICAGFEAAFARP